MTLQTQAQWSASEQATITEAKRVRVDCLLVDLITGTYFVIAENLSPKKAARYLREWHYLDEDSAVMVWPRGLKKPKVLKVKLDPNFNATEEPAS